MINIFKRNKITKKREWYEIKYDKELNEANEKILKMDLEVLKALENISGIYIHKSHFNVPQGICFSSDFSSEDIKKYSLEYLKATSGFKTKLCKTLK